MSRVLVDTSIWIDFFRGRPVAEPLRGLIADNRIVTNDLILAELIPSIHHKKEHRLRELLLSIRKIELRIDWEQLIEMQSTSLSRGLNHTGLPDLIIGQNALAHDLVLFENDKHFSPMAELFGLRLLRPVS